MSRVILSRKGFDTTSGGKPSPIVDGKLLSIPIPRAESNVFYRDLNFDRENNYLQVMLDLNISQFSECHLDPDLRASVLSERHSDWRPVFGQSGSAEGILREKQVGEGDIFLFFGWFKEVVKKNGRYLYKRGTKERHIIYGYMEVGDTPIDLLSNSRDVPEWAKYHPHVSHSKYYKGKGGNRLYLASRHFSRSPNIPGAGCFRFDPRLVLTATDADKKSKWLLPDCFDTNKFKIGCKDISQSARGRTASIVGRGQEVYIDNNPNVYEWATNLIMSVERFS